MNIRTIDTSTKLFGVTWETPIVLAPIGNQRAFHPEGELAVARAAREKRHLQILSTGSTSGLDDVHTARGGPVWFQLYPVRSWNYTLALVRRVEEAGCPVLVLTVDLLGGHNRETKRRFSRLDDSDCKSCHDPSRSRADKYPTFKGIDAVDKPSPQDGLNWKFVDKLKASTSMKLVIKGIVTREDASLCVDRGVDGIVVSNHGGRAEASNRATIDSLPEVVDAVAGGIPVLVDSGFRRGTDIFKALAIGADAVCIGRPYIWGLAAFGQPGVEAVLDILRRELAVVMRQCGTTSLDQINRDHLV